MKKIFGDVIFPILAAIAALCTIVSTIIVFFKGMDAESFAFSGNLLLFGNLLLSSIIILYVIFLCFKRIKSPKYQLAKKYEKYLASKPEYLKKLDPTKVLELSSKTEIAIKEAGKNKNLTMDVHYVLLFTLFFTAKKEIWSISIMNDTEWIDSLEEEVFLDVNLNVSSQKIPLKRIFMIEKKNAEKKLTDATNIRRLIEANSRYIYLYLVFIDNIDESKESLVQNIGAGFIAFDDFVVARDIFKDDEIRGSLFFDESDVKFYKKLFMDMGKFWEPLTLELYDSYVPQKAK